MEKIGVPAKKCTWGCEILYKRERLCYDGGMKKVIEVENLCCKKCAERVEKKLLLLDGVQGAKAKYRRNIVFVESTLSDEELAACVRDAGFGVKEIRPRKGIFG